jgi:hypothetical protein
MRCIYGLAGVFQIEFAESGEHQCGQRLLGSSDPRLKRHVARCKAAGGGITPLPAGKDEKLPREFESRALIGAAGAVSFPFAFAARLSVDSAQTSRSGLEVCSRASEVTIATFSGAN